MTPAKFLFAILIFSISSSYSKSQSQCSRCDCSDYPLREDFCVQCCYTQKGTITSTSPDSVTITPPPSPEQPKPKPKKFKIGPHAKIQKQPEVGKDATIYYHEVDGQMVTSRVDLTDYAEGQLTPDSLPTPPGHPCVKPQSSPFRIPSSLPANATKVLLGASGSFAYGYPFVALRINGEDIITLQRTKQGVLVSAKLYDSHGKLAAEIIDNHFFVKVQPALRLDHSDPHSLRILDGDRTLVDIQFMNPTTIRVLGTLYGPLGTHLDVSEDEMKVNGKGYMRGVCVGGLYVGISVQ